ncbi:MAG: exodeoxyribonuclease VII large subunit [Methanomicrobiaceae archaeon]|nr:exodeoxyribonuclease VII large subunit [Methanomicrobiaceae archaeon]
MDNGGRISASSVPFEIRTVREVSRTIARLLDNADLQEIWVTGEIRDLRRQARGHMYFSLSEVAEGSTFQVRCVMWNSFARELSFDPGDGAKVLAWGSVEVYEPHGKYQLVVRDLRLAGTGEKHLLVQRWKEMLAGEGLFSAERKKPLPRMPARIGVVTSSTGAARRDVEEVIARRFPLQVIISPASVQGEGAYLEIVRALQRIDGTVDVIILGRGGGSFEDLFPFNHPEVVRAVASCTTPVVSGIGHETDVTLADLAADVRAPTPSAAAEIAVPDRNALLAKLASLAEGLSRAAQRRAERSVERYTEIRVRLKPSRLLRHIDGERERVMDIDGRIRRGIAGRIDREMQLVRQLKAGLEACNPDRPLVHGYAIVEKEGRVVTLARDLARGDRITVRMQDGSVVTRVLEVEDAENI